MRWSTYPLCKILGICKRYTTGYDTCLDLGMCRDVLRPQNDYCICWTHFPTNELNIIGNKQGNCLHIFPLTPSAWQNVPLLTVSYQTGKKIIVNTHLTWCTHNDITLLHSSDPCIPLNDATPQHADPDRPSPDTAPCKPLLSHPSYFIAWPVRIQHRWSSYFPWKDQQTHFRQRCRALGTLAFRFCWTSGLCLRRLLCCARQREIEVGAWGGVSEVGMFQGKWGGWTR